MYTFQLIIRFGNFEENERKRYGAAGQMLALWVSTTPRAFFAPVLAGFLSYLGISCRIYAFCAFFADFIRHFKCTLVHSFAHYAPLLCTDLLCTTPKRGFGAYILSYLREVVKRRCGHLLKFCCLCSIMCI